jgi:aspartate aminotransferase-like enzyme
MRIAGGQDDAKPVLFRPSVMGYADRYDALVLVAALGETLLELGQRVAPEQGLAAALRALG